MLVFVSFGHRANYCVCRYRGRCAGIAALGVSVLAVEEDPDMFAVLSSNLATAAQMCTSSSGKDEKTEPLEKLRDLVKREGKKREGLPAFQKAQKEEEQAEAKKKADEEEEQRVATTCIVCGKHEPEGTFVSCGLCYHVIHAEQCSKPVGDDGAIRCCTSGMCSNKKA